MPSWLNFTVKLTALATTHFITYKATPIGFIESKSVYTLVDS